MMTPSDRYDSLIRYYAERNRLDWQGVKAQIRQESNFDPDAKNARSGAIGLMQFMPRTWEEWRDETPGIELPPESGKLVDPRDPEDSIRSGTAYMRWLLDYPVIGGDVQKALAAYNWGIGNVRRVLTEQGDTWRRVLPAETNNYVNRIGVYREEYLRAPDAATRVAQLEAAVAAARRALEAA